jgi:hypothetical protein
MGIKKFLKFVRDINQQMITNLLMGGQYGY